MTCLYVPEMKYAIPLCLSTLLILSAARGRSAENYGATTNAVGHQAGGLETPVNQRVTPAGALIELPGLRPNALALSPDGKLLAISGRVHELLVLEPATGKILQHVPFPADKTAEHAPISPLIFNPHQQAQLSYTGLAFSPDGSRIYLANVNGDIKVFAVGRDRKVSPLFSIPLPRATAPYRTYEIPAGIAVSPDGRKIYVALNLSNRLAELDAATGQLLRIWEVGVDPFAVVLAGKKIYVSNWGGRRPDAESLTGPAGAGTRVRVDARSIASEGSVSVIDLAASRSATGNPPTEILTGLRAGALALSPNRRWLVVANAGSDTLSVIDTRADKIVETICVRQNPGDAFGAQPNALAFDRTGKTLFVCHGTQNAVAMFQFKAGNSKLLGLIPVGWFPGAIAFEAKQQQICVANVKSLAPDKTRAYPPWAASDTTGFSSGQYLGSLSLVPIPSQGELATFTRTALANLRYPLLAQSKLPPRAQQPARPVPELAGPIFPIQQPELDERPAQINSNAVFRHGRSTLLLGPAGTARPVRHKVHQEGQKENSKRKGVQLSPGNCA